MTWMQEIARLRKETRDWVLNQVIPSLIVYTLTAASSAIGDGDAMESSDDARDGGSSDTDKGQQPTVRIEPWGHRGVPVKGLRGAAFRLGSSNILFFGIAPTQKHGPQGMGAGETALYSEQIEKGVHLDGDGNNNINSRTADNKDVIVNGGTDPVARQGDTVTASGSMGTWAGVIEGLLNGLGAPVPGPSQFANTVALPGELGEIETGAPNFKG